MAPVLAAHAAVLALVMVGSGTEKNGVAPMRSLALFDIAPSAPARKAPPPSVKKIIIARTVTAEPVSLETAPPDLAPIPALSEAGLAPGEMCDVAGKVQAALRDDPKVRAALAMLPRDARSVANAVMLWDGRWITGTTTSTRYALDQIRAAVIATVASAPASCRQEAQAGPTLMLLAGSPDTVVALGSGRWRWMDVFGTAVDAPTAIASRVDQAPPPAT